MNKTINLAFFDLGLIINIIIILGLLLSLLLCLC